MKQPNLLQVLLFFVIFLPGIAIAYLGVTANNYMALWAPAVTFILGLLAGASLQIADQWEKAVVLRLGKFTGLRGPGAFFIRPIFESVAYWIDTRVITTSFRAEKTLTKDTVPVDVEAVLFWRVVNPEKAALEVEDYKSAISWASQTALREVIGK